MRAVTVADRELERRRSVRTTRIVLITFAIVEAVVIFGLVVPTLLESSSQEQAPAPHAGKHP
jgi:hypothetical protein